MKKTVLLLTSVALLAILPACTFVPKTGMKETTWLRKTALADLVYIEGNVKAYRSAGSYYYFQDGLLVKVGPSLVSAAQVGAN